MEEKKTSDFISDGVLAYGVEVGRFVFQNEHKTVYDVTDFPHIGGSDFLWRIRSQKRIMRY